MTWGEDKFRVCLAFAMDEDHVAPGSVDQSSQNLSWICRAVFPKDTLIGDASGDFNSRVAGDLAKDLVKAGVICGDGKGTVSIDDLGALRGPLLRSQRNLWYFGSCCRWRCREGGCGLTGNGGLCLRTFRGLGRQGCRKGYPSSSGESDWRKAEHVLVGRDAQAEVIVA